ncbi:orotidine-5-phosphate decarboxylase [Streptococcus pneumoniae]|nr:orotidine-5-phosphate decarboxylase [Streptococcus pneumoniae]
MREHRPVIALDFPSFEAVKEFLALFPAEESLYLKGRDGALLRSGA